MSRSDYYLAPCLDVGRREVDTVHPGRDKKSDGWISDAAHARSGPPESGGSKHSPNKRGCVCAWDCDDSDVDMPRLIAAWMAHPSSNLIIYNRIIRIKSRGWRAQRYTGPNPHDKHGHIECEMTARDENDTRPWGYAKTMVATPPKTIMIPVKHVTENLTTQTLTGGLVRLPTLRQTSGAFSFAAKLLQRALAKLGYNPGKIDGYPGAKTMTAAKTFQRAVGLPADGVVDPKTWLALVQALLTKIGHYGGKIDAVLGQTTLRAVRNLQRARGLIVDGVIGPKTWTALIS